jgi:hypothetical protein
MMRRRSLAQSLPEVALIFVGVAIAGVMMSALHSH